mgnify:CR=1 FL=1
MGGYEGLLAIWQHSISTASVRCSRISLTTSHFACRRCIARSSPTRSPVTPRHATLRRATQSGDRLSVMALAPPSPTPTASLTSSTPSASTASPTASTASRVALVLDELWLGSRPQPPSGTLASLVADRRLVRPGESIKITGMVACA